MKKSIFLSITSFIAASAYAQSQFSFSPAANPYMEGEYAAQPEGGRGALVFEDAWPWYSMHAEFGYGNLGDAVHPGGSVSLSIPSGGAAYLVNLPANGLGQKPSYVVFRVVHACSFGLTAYAGYEGGASGTFTSGLGNEASATASWPFLTPDFGDSAKSVEMDVVVSGSQFDPNASTTVFTIHTTNFNANASIAARYIREIFSNGTIQYAGGGSVSGGGPGGTLVTSGGVETAQAFHSNGPQVYLASSNGQNLGGPRGGGGSEMRSLSARFMTPGTNNVQIETSVSDVVNGQYAGVFPIASGNYDVVLLAKGMLVKRISNIYVAQNGTLSIGSLHYGDIVRNNVVNTDDYSKLSAYYGMSDQDSGWLVKDSDNIAPVDCDLDNDGTVSTDDYLLLSNSFDLEGDPEWL